MKIKNFLKRHKKKLLIGGFALAILLVFKIIRGSQSQVSQTINIHETILVEKGDFLDSVLENGKVYSEDSVQVYSKLQLPVKEVLVKVGDKVEEGDIIARLDTDNIQKEIDLKKAQMNQQARASQGEIKNANERLNIAVRNKKEGTNPAVVSAKAQADSAYEQWMGALKTYEDFKKSLEGGYNEQIVSMESQKLSLKNAFESSELSLNLARERKENAEENIKKSKDLAERRRKDRDYFKREVDRLEHDISYIKSQMERGSGLAGEIKTLESQILVAKNELSLITDPSEKEKKENEITSLSNKISDLEASLAETDRLSRDIDSLSSRLSEASQDYQMAESEYQKYKGEYESLEKSLSMNDEEIAQAEKALDIARKNLDMAGLQEISSLQSREDLLATYKNTADVAEKTYKSALENVKIVEISQNDEIKSLNTSLGIIKSGADNSVSQIDLKYLNENLEDAVIKAPISGTITEDNMIIGSVPTNYVVKIETVERVIIKSFIKEYDLYRVKPGVEVEITSNVIGKDTVFKARVETISPTPVADMSNPQSNEVLYEVKILIEEGEEKLIPGMSVRTRYIIDKRENVYVVPSNSVYEKNKKFFLLAVKDENITTIEEIPISIVTENDFEYVVEFGTEPKNLRVISSPDKYSPGTEVMILRDEENSVEDENNMELKIEKTEKKDDGK